MGRGVQGIALRGLHLHKRPQALGHIVDCDDAATGGHITADDLAVPVDIVDRTIQATGGPGNHLFERDVAITGNGRRRIVSALRLIVCHDLSGCVVGKEALAAGYAGDSENGPLAGRILHDRRLLALGGVLFHLSLKLGILFGFLLQHPVIVAYIRFVGVRIGKAACVNVAGGIAACGFVALVVPNVGLKRHKQAAGDLAGVVRDIGHHPLDVFLGDGVHLAQSCLGDCFLPQGVGVRAGGAGVGVAIEEAGCAIPIGIAQIHAVKLLARCHGRAVGIGLAGGGQPGRPAVGVCGRRNAGAGGGRCKCRGRQDGE